MAATFDDGDFRAVMHVFGSETLLLTFKWFYS